MKLDSAPITISAVAETQSQPEQTNTEPVVVDSPQRPESVAVVFGTTFITIFLAEIGDKTQLSTLLMSAESHAPWVVFIGSAAALITTSLLGVLLGSWISSKLSPKVVEKSAGVMLLLISVMLVWDVVKG
ncbi:TMEM165/GDT1 family protein [Fortiea contorta]|uniref:TMEM165/GDT1 family protein n=1 Tax=Fortiea contorta TaxID=1892405 RepID=UPI0003485B3D|nr:TMEM165/GDT1 family protein [Fortiea contorta]